MYDETTSRLTVLEKINYESRQYYEKVAKYIPIIIQASWDAMYEDEKLIEGMAG